MLKYRPVLQHIKQNESVAYEWRCDCYYSKRPLNFSKNDAEHRAAFQRAHDDYSVDRSNAGGACADVTDSDQRERAEDRSGSLSVTRSEEHTSELQSHLNLVCRLLLEKKKKRSDTR